jgi:pimeloyl-ACP methyl ester carboxylesterase
MCLGIAGVQWLGIAEGQVILVGLAYERIGSGEPLVLLHGIGHRRQAWNAVLGRLTPHREVILVDLPGHGESPPFRADGQADGRWIRESLIAEFIGFLDELGLERPHLAGNSVGGRLALEAAERGRAASVTALSPAGFWANEAELAYARSVCKVMQLSGELAKPLRSALARTISGRALIYAAIVNKPSQVTPEQASGDFAAFLAASRAVNAILAAAVPFNGSIPTDVPVTIGWGTRDRLLRPRQGLLAKALLPQAHLVLLRGCGHVPVTDDPPLVAEVLLRGSKQARRVEDRPKAGTALGRVRNRDSSGRVADGACPKCSSLTPCHRRRHLARWWGSAGRATFTISARAGCCGAIGCRAALRLRPRSCGTWTRPVTRSPRSMTPTGLISSWSA